MVIIVKRIFYFDNIKGLLILFIVLLHTLSICSKYYNFDYSWFKIIMFFMIPLFIFVTGVFAKKSKRTPIKRAVKMLIIYIIAQVLITLYYAYILKIIPTDKSILIPRFTLWYLLTCFWLYLSEYLFRKFKFKYVFITSILITLFIGFISIISDTLSLSRSITALPFFILGYYQKDIKLFDKIEKSKNIIYILTIIITIWFFFNQDYFLFKDTYFKYNYFTYGTPLDCFIKRCILLIFVFIFSSFILLIIPKKKTVLANLGNKTLDIYLIHGALLKTILTYKLFINNSFIGTIITYIIVILISLGVHYTVKKVKSLINKNIKIKNLT